MSATVSAEPARAPSWTARLTRFVQPGGMGRSMAHVGGATALAQVVGLAVLPLVSRHLGPVAFGQFGLFFTLATTMGAAGPLGLPEAMLAARRWSEALALLGAAIRAVFVMGLVCAGLTYVCLRYDLFGTASLPDWVWPAMAPVVWLISLAMVLQIWLVRRRRFTALAGAYISQGVLRGGTQVSGAFATPGLGWLVLLGSELLGRGSTVLVMATPARREILAACRIRERRWVGAVRRYWRFPAFRTPSMLANNLAAGLPLFLLASAFGAHDVGNFSFMMGIVVGPIGFMQRAVGDVFLGEFAARRRRSAGAARALMIRTAAALAGTALPATLVLGIFGPLLFATVFGQGWRGAGVLAAAYAPAFMANLVVAPLGGVLNVTNRPGYKLMVDLTGIAALALAFAISRRLHLDAAHTTLAFSLASVGGYALYFGFILGAVRNPTSAATVEPEAPKPSAESA